jgi:hypothetical protein
MSGQMDVHGALTLNSSWVALNQQAAHLISGTAYDDRAELPAKACSGIQGQPRSLTQSSKST